MTTSNILLSVAVMKNNSVYGNTPSTASSKTSSLDAPQTRRSAVSKLNPNNSTRTVFLIVQVLRQPHVMHLSRTTAGPLPRQNTHNNITHIVSTSEPCQHSPMGLLTVALRPPTTALLPLSLHIPPTRRTRDSPLAHRSTKMAACRPLYPREVSIKALMVTRRITDSKLTPKMTMKTTRPQVYHIPAVGLLSAEGRMEWDWTRTLIRDKAMVSHLSCLTVLCRQRQHLHRYLVGLHFRGLLVVMLQMLALAMVSRRDRMLSVANSALRNSGVSIVKMSARPVPARNRTHSHHRHVREVPVSQARMFHDKCPHRHCPRQHHGQNDRKARWVTADGEAGRVNRQSRTAQTIHHIADRQLRRTARAIRHWQAHMDGVHINSSTSIKWSHRRQNS